MNRITKLDLFKRAEELWDELLRDELGGYSGINRPFYIHLKFKEIYELSRHPPENCDRDKIAQLMLRCGLATGHGDTIDDLLGEMEWQIREIQAKAKDNSI